MEMSVAVEDPKVATYRFMTGQMDPPHMYGRRWTPGEEHNAVRDYKDGIPIKWIVERLGRSIYGTQVRKYEATGRWKRSGQRRRRQRLKIKAVGDA
ncbi:MAG: hypothetical protein F4Y02_11060 [Chloroflexi bacterium]|nr:hypothetical protein [Chloroflexota bacterium]